MAVAQIPTLDQLKTALRLYGESVTGWMKTLRNPDGEKVTRTNVYQALNHGTPQWLVDEINKIVRKAHRDFPGYYKKLRKDI